MKVAACNFRSTPPGGDDVCASFPNNLSPGTHFTNIFVFADWHILAFGNKDTMDTIDYCRVGFSILAFLSALCCLFLNLGHIQQIIWLVAFNIILASSSLVLLRFDEGFPLSSTSIYYGSAAIAGLASSVLAHLLAKVEALGASFVTFFGVPWIVILVGATIEDRFPLIGSKDFGSLDILKGERVTYVVAALLAIITSAALPHLNNAKKAAILHFSIASLFAICAIFTVFSTLDYFQDKKPYIAPYKTTSLGIIHFAGAAGFILIASFVRIKFMQEEFEDDEGESEIEMSGDPNVDLESPAGEKRKSVITDNPLWSLSSPPDPKEQDT